MSTTYRIRVRFDFDHDDGPLQFKAGDIYALDDRYARSLPRERVTLLGTPTGSELSFPASVASMSADSIADTLESAAVDAPAALARIQSSVSGDRGNALPKVLIFGCSIAQQCNAYLHANATANPTTTTTNVGEHRAKSLVLNVANGAIFAPGDRIQFPLYNARLYVAEIASIATNALTLTRRIPAAVRDAQAVTKLTAAQSSANLLQAIGAANSGVIRLGSPAEVLPAYGYGGALFREMYADLERDLRFYRPNIVIMHPYENDLTIATGGGGYTLDQLLALTRWVTDLCLKYGATPVMCSSMPYYLASPLRGIPASRKSDFYAILDYLTLPVSGGKSQYQIDFPGAYGVDLSTPWLDPAFVNDASYPCRPLPGWTDGVHPNTSKRFAIGANVEPVLAQILPTQKSWLDYCQNPRSQASMALATGVVTNMQAGSVAPATYTAQAFGTAIAATSKNPDGSLKLVASWPGASSRTGDFIKIRCSFTFPTVWAGGSQRFRVYLRYRINSMTGMAQVYPNAYLAPNLDNYAGDTGSDMLATHPTDGRIMLLTTPEFEAGFSEKSGTWNTSVEMSFTVAPNTKASPSNAAIDIDVFELGIVPAVPEVPHEFI